MSEEQNLVPPAVPADAEVPAKPARRKAPARTSRKKAEVVAEAPAVEVVPIVGEAAEVPAAKKPAKPRAKRAPRKPKAEAPVVVETTADLFAAVDAAVDVAPLAVEPVPAAEPPVVEAHAVPEPEAVPVEVVMPVEQPQPVEAEPVPEVLALEPVLSDASVEQAVAADGGGLEDETSQSPADSEEVDTPAGPRRKRKRRRGRGERNGQGERRDSKAGEASSEDEAAEAFPAVAETLAEVEREAPSGAPVDAVSDAVESSMVTEGESVAEAAAAEPAPLTIVSLGLDVPPVLSADALVALRNARIVLGTADALDRLAGLELNVPQQLCAAESAHVDLRAIGHAGSVLVVTGDGAGDGPAAELLAELGPAHVRVLPGVGRVQAACAALGLSAEIVSVVDLRRAPLATLRGQLRAHRLLALPIADAATPVAVARLLLDSGFAGARVWVCEFFSGQLQARAWLASELVELREAFDPRAVLIVATGPSSGLFAELPGLSDAALGEGAPDALPLAVRTLALAWLQPAAWENGWVISDGEASLALEWARAVPTARVRAVGMEPSLLGMNIPLAGVGDNLSAVGNASPLRCREWPAPEAVFIRGAAGLGDWLAAAWARLAPGGRLVASAEDDQARGDLLAFAAQVPAEAWQELSLSRGETVAGRLRFTPSAPVRLALWRKPALS
ncbi:SAM-dependent methyltransferase [Zoogloea sp.]|uniref:SAM-dependent methyltransferase n=1 Tax=Zoogloea sp. TaxID=49181 RepID=UPI0035B38288